MPSPFSQQPLKTRTALILFVKGAAAPLVLYFERPEEVYAEIQGIIKSGVNKLVEKETIGPVKKFTVMSANITAVALQTEQYV